MSTPMLLAATSWTPFLVGALIIAIVLLLWDTIEVGRNDAANLINAVFGSRVLTRRVAVYVAGVGVILGAAASSNVIETARKGIFKPATVAEQGADHDDGLKRVLAIYTAVYIVDTVLLFGYSAFGMPVSTTACLVFELLGAALAIGGVGAVSWPKAGKVVTAIIMSILISGFAAFVIQRAVRGAVRDRTKNLATMLAHGGWIGGGMLAGLTYFMLVKGMKHIGYIKELNQWLAELEIVQEYGSIVIVFALWAAYAVVVHALLVVFGKPFAKRLLPGLAILGTVAMAFAFGQNDLANCASPGLAAVHLILHSETNVGEASKIPIQVWALAGCGVLMAAGMFTRNAQRVTSSAVHAGSMSHHVRLWAPNWCLGLARLLLRFRGPGAALAPPPATTVGGKTMHYDVLRACVILSVSASVIAFASGMGLPVSTTYVSFAAVVATGLADRILQRGDAVLKLARTIWVVFSWFASAVIAATSAGVVCLVVYYLDIWGIGLGIAANLYIRRRIKKRSDAHEKRVREEARERLTPELFAETYE